MSRKKVGMACPDSAPKASLGIVLTHATQFDGPLFRFLAAHATFDITVYYTRENGDALSKDDELGTQGIWDNDVRSGYQYFVRPTGVLGGLTLLRRIAWNRHDLLVISGYSPSSHLLIALLGRIKRKAVGLRSDSILTYGQPTGVKGAIKAIALPLILRLYATGHPTGRLAAEYLRHYGLAEEAIFLFPYNVDNDWLSAMAQSAAGERSELRKRYGIPLGSPVVLGVLKFVSREDPMTLLYAFKRLHRMVPEAHLLLVGDGELRGEIEQEIEKANLEHLVHLPGYLPYSQLPAHYAMADIFVHPATREPWGVSVNEAMVCGVPVITSSNVGGAWDLITDGITGMTFPVGDHETLAQRLQQLASSEEARREMASKARKQMDQWHYRETSKQLEAALQFATGNKCELSRTVIA